MNNRSIDRSFFNKPIPKFSPNEDNTLILKSQLETVKNTKPQKTQPTLAQRQDAHKRMRYEAVLDHIKILEKRDLIDSGRFASFVISDFSKLNQGFTDIPVEDFNNIFSYLHERGAEGTIPDSFDSAFESLLNNTIVGNKYRALLLEALTKYIKQIAIKQQPAISTEPGEYAKKVLKQQQAKLFKEISMYQIDNSQNRHVQVQTTKLLREIVKNRNLTNENHTLSSIIDSFEKIKNQKNQINNLHKPAVQNFDLGYSIEEIKNEDLSGYQSNQKLSKDSQKTSTTETTNNIYPITRTDSDDLSVYSSKQKPSNISF